MNREQIDKIAWQTIHAHPPMPFKEGLDWNSRRARDYQELEWKLQSGIDFEHAWSDFLHAFYAHRTASFFAHPSPASLSVEWQALLAGAAEWLSAEFGLPHPAWTDEPRYFLAEPWDPAQEFIDMAPYIAENLARSPEAFRKRNVAFLSRNLITL